MPRPANRWRYMTNERRRGRRRWLYVLPAIALVGAATWFFARGWGAGHAGGAAEQSSEKPADAGDEARRASGDAGSAAANPSKTGRPAAATPRTNDPNGVLNLGDGRRPPSSGSPSGNLPSGGSTSSGSPSAGSPSAGSASGRSAPSNPQPPSSPAPAPPSAGAAPPAGAAPSGTTSPSTPPAGDGDRVVATPEPLAKAMALAQRDPLEARRQLTALVVDPRLSPAEHARAREAAAAINRSILFSSTVVPGDPFARTYVVQQGDSLDRIAKSQGLEADWRFLKRINGVADERKLRSGQTIKLVPGAFHAVVDKSEFRMDLFLGEGAQRVYVASFPVGLGEYNSTPTGHFKVRPKSKLVNPAWTNPRTGEHFKPDDPANPLGEYWIGIMGTDEANASIEAYGIHGTIDPASVGHQASMGCVRMLSADISLVYELLTEPNSTIAIVE
ncbi:MAG: L,D-transpeptidase family protein [Phycisphaerales bacterium]